MSRRRKARSPVTLPDPTLARSVLAIAAEPGDEVFGCGGTLRHHVEAGDRISILVVSDGCGELTDPATLAKTREGHESACRAAARILEYQEPRFWNEHDQDIAYGERLTQRLAELILETAPALIYAPSPLDPHPTRAALGLTVREAVWRGSLDCVLACYEVDGPLPADRVEDVADVLALKRSAMDCFKGCPGHESRLRLTTTLNRLRAFSLEPPSKAAEGIQTVDGATLTQPMSGSARLRDYHAEPLTDQPLVSVIVRSQNRPELTEALDSVALQTWRHIEVLLIDVAGTNGFSTGDWCGQFPLRVVSKGHPLGRGAAANTGLDQAQGQYLLFLDDDDWLLPGHVALLVDALRRSNDARVAYSGIECRRQSDQGDWEVVRVFNDPYDRTRLLVENYIPIHAVLLDRALVTDQTRFDEALEVYEDWDFWVQLSRQTDFRHVDRITAIYRISRESGFGVRLDPRTAAGLQAFFERWRHRWSPQDLLDVTAYHKQRATQAQTVARHEMEALSAALVERDAQIAELRTEIGRRADVLYEALAARDNRIAELQTDLRRQADRLTETVATHELEMARLQATEGEKSDALYEALAGRDRRIAELRADLQRQAAELAAALHPVDGECADQEGGEALGEALRARDNRISELQDELQRQVDAFGATLAARETQISELRTEVQHQADTSREVMAARDLQIAELRSEVQRQADALREALAAREQLVEDQQQVNTLKEALAACNLQLTEVRTRAQRQADVLNEALSARNLRIGELQTEAEARQATLAEREAHIRALQTEADAREATLAEREDQIRALQSEAEARQATLAERETRISVLQSEAEARQAALVEHEARISALQSEAAARQARIAELDSELSGALAEVDRLALALTDSQARSDRLATEQAADQGRLQARDDALSVLGQRLHASQEQGQQLVDKLTGLYVSAGWPISSQMLAAERRLPMLTRASLGAVKTLFWTLSFRLPAALRRHREAQRILTSGLLDEQWYTRTYPHVLLKEYRPVIHWMVVGWREGLNPSPLFETAWYLGQSSDLGADQPDPITHYLRQGAVAGLDPHPLFDTDWYLETAGESTELADNPLAHFIKAGAKERHSPHPLFDLAWYLDQNPDVEAAGINPLLHFIEGGAREGRDPHPLFPLRWYLEQHPEVVASGENPLLHFVRHGIPRGADPHPLFDGTWYRSSCADPTLAGQHPFIHYLRQRGRGHCSPHPLFDSAWYLRTYPDVRASGLDPLRHFMTLGATEGRDPNPFFDSDWYRQHNPDIRDANPLYHYLIAGAREGRNPSPHFNTNWYWSRYSDIRYLNPLVHYVLVGAGEGRSALPESDQGGEGSLAPAEALEAASAALAEWRGDWSELFPPPEPAAPGILVIDWKPPTPDRDSGSYRMRMILDLMLAAGHEVDFVGDRPAEDPTYAQDLRAAGMGVVIGPVEALAHLQASGGRYRTVWISRPELAEQYLSMVRAFAVRARVIYDTVDLHWVRFQRGIEFADDPAELRELADRYERIERSNARAADLTIAITPEEQRTLLDLDPGLEVAVIPNIHRISDHVSPLAGRADLFFIGGFGHAPNIDAVLWCVREIMPLVHQKLPKLRLHIVGSDMPDEIKRLATPLIDPIGYVEDVTPWFERSRIFIAPLRHGAGMKGKIGQSLSFGLPVVTTAIGAEGIGLRHELDALVADDPQGIAEAVVRLCTDDALWSRISANGHDLVKRRYSSEAVAGQLLPLLD